MNKKFIGGRMSGKSYFDDDLSPLEALEKVRFYAGDTWLNCTEWNIIEKSLKALEIIKNKVNLTEASNPNGTKQKCLVTVVLDNDKDFELLKEVFQK